MIEVTLMGGMGNQMFQYACGYSLAKLKHTSLRLDLSFLNDRTPRENFVFRNYDLDIFNLHNGSIDLVDYGRYDFKMAKLSRLVNRCLPVGLRSVFHERQFEYDKDISLTSQNVRLEGYWQSPKYFRLLNDDITQLFSLSYELQPFELDLHEEISNSTSVCLNVRRADFVGSSFHGTCNVDYYLDSLRLLESNIGDFEVFVFSDDIEWCRDNLNFNVKTTFVDHKYSGLKFGVYLELMKACKHFIIPNSTFAWWAAYLSKNSEKIVVAPQNWFLDKSINTTDLVPDSWLRV